MQLGEVSDDIRIDRNDVPSSRHEIVEVGHRSLEDAVKEINLDLLWDGVEGGGFCFLRNGIETDALVLVGDVLADDFTGEARLGLPCLIDFSSRD